jgi:prepilin-type N-terminal cleavage/methylation domain-containing protein
MMKISVVVSKSLNKGFTLIELLVVVAILAVISGMVISNYSGQQRSNAQYQVAQHEMEQVRQAIIRFQKDNLIAVARTSAADLSFLFEKGSLDDWNKDYELGWRGPYMSGGDSGLVDIGDNLKLDGSDKPEIVDSGAHQRQRAIPDPFTLAPIDNGNAIVANPPCSENTSNNQCLFDWRFVGQANADSPHAKFGRPYLIFDLTDKDRARIVSMGSNGIYDSDSAAQICSASGDDIVRCIYQ